MKGAKQSDRLRSIQLRVQASLRLVVVVSSTILWARISVESQRMSRPGRFDTQLARARGAFDVKRARYAQSEKRAA